ncbi:ankyrin repeat-containing domain protein [Cercophora newfieldiana]|uniref:Ankyrin repeat-containing domain protein n=1 Tax=Cercophora newfieldiana TaxID=92897 RepID=A0AA40CX53_9PEZI|nr:ankyrin repeat-containing domain protein [Cercophora newfieldiana]
MSHIGQRLEYTEDAISQLGDALYLSQKTTLLFMNKRFDSMESSMIASVRDPIQGELALLRKELSQARQPTTPSRLSRATPVHRSSPPAPLSHPPSCPLTCRCHCHFTRTTSRFRTHPSLGPLLGALAVTYAGDSSSPRACSDRECVNTRKYGVESSSRELSLTVSLPPWLLRASLTLLYTSHPRPEFLLRVFHHLPTGVPGAAHNIFGYIDRNDIDGVKRLLSTRQASVHDVRYSRNVSPLFAATERKQVDMVKLLLQAGADPFQATTDGATPLLSALQYYLSGTPEGRELVTLLPVFNTLDLSPLHLATIGILHVDLPHALCKPEFLTDLDRLDLGQYTPLHLAAIRGDAAVTKALIRAGAKVDLPGGRKKTPLSYACAWGHFDVAKMLLDAGAEVDSRDAFGITPLMRAGCYPLSEMRLLELLLERGAQVNARANDLSTALGHAVAYECLDSAKFLLDNGADVNARDRMGDAPIIEAVLSGWRGKGGHDGLLKVE